uniref:RNA-directed DNA polymerase n=1 Tax=Myotis myotis TaxID=51298 RepID=A0A7J7QS92_MYOMY|nr:hypothetical protein mMyoMyo1_012004 [Myotis myotis]
MDTKTLYKILANQIPQYVKEITHHDQVIFVPWMQSWYNIHKSISVIIHRNKLKDKNHMIISIDTKHLTKFNTHFLIKTLSRVRIEGSYFNIIKTIYEKPTTNGKNVTAFPLRTGTRQGCWFLPLLFNIVMEVLVTLIRQEKK